MYNEISSREFAYTRTDLHTHTCASGHGATDRITEESMWGM